MVLFKGQIIRIQESIIGILDKYSGQTFFNFDAVMLS